MRCMSPRLLLDAAVGARDFRHAIPVRRPHGNWWATLLIRRSRAGIVQRLCGHSRRLACHGPERRPHSLTPCALPPMCSQRAKTKAVSKGDDPSAYRRLTINCSHGAQLHQFGRRPSRGQSADNPILKLSDRSKSIRHLHQLEMPSPWSVVASIASRYSDKKMHLWQCQFDETQS